ncbi:MAG: hypothetical protein AAGN35_07525 [Bacteroidota bacterium]
MNAYVMIGGSNTRKSSICRALTGCFNRNIREIRTLSGDNLRLYVRVSSLQESRTTPAEYVDEVNEKAVRNVLFSLWPQSQLDDPASFPDAQTYLDDFLARGWHVAAIAVLGQSTIPLTNPSLRQTAAAFPNTFIDPINVSAAQVRKFFAWE